MINMKFRKNKSCTTWASCGWWRGEIIIDIYKGYLGMINIQLRKNKSCVT